MLSDGALVTAPQSPIQFSLSCNPFRTHTYKTLSRNSFRFHTYEKQRGGGRVPWSPARRTLGVGRPSWLNRTPFNSFPFNLLRTLVVTTGGSHPSSQKPLSPHFVPPLFSYSYKSLFSQPISFDIHTNWWGGRGYIHAQLGSGEDAGLPGKSGRDPQKPGESPALHEARPKDFGFTETSRVFCARSGRATRQARQT
jgi:hypothetical protein